MALKLFQSDTYRTLMQDHLRRTLAFLLESGQEFAVAAEVAHIDITPELPRAIRKGFGETALFVAAGYTFESAWVDAEHLYFEAGFGEENIGAEVTIPLLAIKQIFVGEYPIAINIAFPVPRRDRQADTPEHSMNALLSNPENKKWIKNNKK